VSLSPTLRPAAPCTCAGLRQSCVGGTTLVLNFTETWGDPDLIGLAGE
jgi:hypothetical protein